MSKGREPVGVALALANRLRQQQVEHLVGEPSQVIEALAGLAVLHGQLDRIQPGHDWDVEAHRCIRAAASVIGRTRISAPGMFGGLAGVAFATWTLSRGGARYQRLLTELDRGLIASTAQLSARIADNPGAQPAHAFDVISGVAGAGAYLLCRQGDARAEEALREVLAALVALGEELAGQNDGIRDCGMAHGVPGPLALLALALRSGVCVAGQRESVARLSRWLATARCDDRWGLNWPFEVPWPEPPFPADNAWCYGSPGVARALWLAGEALEDNALRGLGVAAMIAVCRRPSQARGVDRSPGLCHGVAGLLQITLRFAHDTGNATFADAATILARSLLASYEPQHLLGYQFPGGLGGVDQPGLIDGAAGVALALIAAETDIPSEWDRMLLLA